MYKLCIVEDDSEVAFQLSQLLSSQGYDIHQVNSFINPACVVEDIVVAHPQLILLDLCLPGIDGEVVCRMLREKTPAPIMVVTSRNTELDELTLLTYGADDFISKPYNPRLLCARVYRLLQRAYEGESSASAILRHNTLVLNLSTCQVSNGAQSATLTKNEMKILALLMNHAGSIVSRQTIQEELWQTDEFVDDNTLTVNMSHVRKTLESIGVSHAIVTHRGLGYCLM